VSILERLVGAPISWGVCEVPGWGIELAQERVFGEMRELGFKATELGSVGYLPDDPDELSALLANFEIELVGGFVPLVLHDPAQAEDALAAARQAATLLGGAGGTEFITSMVASTDWAPRFELDETGWAHAAKMFSAVEEVVGEYGLTQAIHPHLGTMIERRSDVREVLDRTDAAWCFDTGHLLIGGYDPMEFVADARDRIRHVHLKDTILDLARPVLDGELSIMQGVQNGMFCPMGRGDVAIGEIVMSLERSGYDRWYVLEQDVALTTGEPPVGQGPKLDVQMSVDYLRGVEAVLNASPEAS